ncbi:MAG TPA: EAL domain-containing protein [Kofleriaceae bacterium]
MRDKVARTPSHPEGPPPQAPDFPALDEPPEFRLLDHDGSDVEMPSPLEDYTHGMSLPRYEDVPPGAPGCQRCEVLPRLLRGPGTFRLRLGFTHTLGKVLHYLQGTSWEHSEHNGTVSVRVPEGSLAPLVSPLMDLMSIMEQDFARATFQFDGDSELDAANESISLKTFNVKARSAWLLEILRENRLYSIFQPIVKCFPRAAAPELFGFECLARAEVDGQTAMPGTMFDLARRAELLFQLDLAARSAAIRAAAAAGISAKVFINFSPNSIYNPLRCLASTVRLVDQVGLRRDQVVFEIVEGDRLPEMKQLQRIVATYRNEGFQVALDDVGSGYATMQVLVALRPEYVKIDMDLVRNVHVDPDRAVVTGKLLEMVQELGLRTIAEGVETTGELDWLRAHGADYLQGYLFARPARTPPPVQWQP